MKILVLPLGALLAAGVGYGVGSLHAGARDWAPVFEGTIEFCKDVMHQQGCFEACSAAVREVEEIAPE